MNAKTIPVYSYVNRRPRVRLAAGSGGAKQAFANECDINQIMAKYQKTGAVAHVAKHIGEYNFATSATFHDAMNIVAKANSLFEELPSKIRNLCKNDPATFLDFVQDEANADELVELGLANAPIPEGGVEAEDAARELSDLAPNPPPAESS